MKLLRALLFLVSVFLSQARATLPPDFVPPKELRAVLNLSSRALVADGGVLIAGFITEEREAILLIRAVGPGIAQFGVEHVMPNPRVKIFIGSTEVANNDDWGSTNQPTGMPPEVYQGYFAQEESAVGAFHLKRGSKDAAMIIKVLPGAYTVHVSDVTGGGGDVLLEVYDLSRWFYLYRPYIWPDEPLRLPNSLSTSTADAK
jgi:hypothetical protein